MTDYSFDDYDSDEEWESAVKARRRDDARRESAVMASLIAFAALLIAGLGSCLYLIALLCRAFV